MGKFYEDNIKAVWTIIILLAIVFALIIPMLKQQYQHYRLEQIGFSWEKIERNKAEQKERDETIVSEHRGKFVKVEVFDEVTAGGQDYHSYWIWFTDGEDTTKIVGFKHKPYDNYDNDLIKGQKYIVKLNIYDTPVEIVTE